MIKFTVELFILCSVIDFSVSQLDDFLPQLFGDFPSIYFHSREEPNINTDIDVRARNLTALRNSSFNPARDTKFIVHGYYHNGKRQWLRDMVEALLGHGDYNVFRVDWGNGSSPEYATAFVNTRRVGKELAIFINTLIREFNFNASQAHCIGHSMGAYVCAFCGQDVENLGWITSLDDGPRAFPEVPNNQKLDPADALFVDAIYTDKIILGDPYPHGNINIYINGGYNQPRCNFSLVDAIDPNDIYDENLLDSSINEVFCDHMSILFYYIESIRNPSCKWIAYECQSYEQFQAGQCKSCGADNSKCAFLGLRAIEYPDKSSEYRVFYTNANGEEPYCKEVQP
ncbi:UNVERIFIED_CONTAM: hypothetical protein RMT77_008730 [Armadillidium vulgare]